MNRYSEAVFCSSFKHRDILVDIYRRKQGATCCDIDHDLGETFCLLCGRALEPEDIYQICISGVYIPGAESYNEEDAQDLAMLIIDESPEALLNPEAYILSRLDVESDDDDYDDYDDDSEPRPGSTGDRFNHLLSGDASGKKNGGGSDPLDSAGPEDIIPDDRITSDIIDEALSGPKTSIVPAADAGPSLSNAARLAMLAKQLKQLKWCDKARRIIDAAKRKKR